MTVNNQNALGSAAAETGRAQDIQKADRGDTASSGNADADGDRVEFSSTLGRLSQAISTEGAQRSSRVQAVAAAYQNGTYRPDPVAISRAMVASACSME